MNPSLYEQIKKNDSDKKRIKQKFLFAIILSNSLVAYAVSQFSVNQNLGTQDMASHPTETISHIHHKLVIIPIKNLVPFSSSQKEIPISLLSTENKVVIAKAYLHLKVSSLKEDESKEIYQVEIPENELIKLVDKKNESLTAVPQIDSKIMSRYQDHRQKESKYEVHF